MARHWIQTPADFGSAKILGRRHKQEAGVRQIQGLVVEVSPSSAREAARAFKLARAVDFQAEARRENPDRAPAAAREQVRAADQDLVQDRVPEIGEPEHKGRRLLPGARQAGER